LSNFSLDGAREMAKHTPRLSRLEPTTSFSTAVFSRGRLK
jgi:hypothetical protein